jgi:hypothetical protein
MESELLLQRLQAPIPEAEKQEVKQQLETYINHLIDTDFARLVQLLYTVDIDEKKLKNLLREQPEKDAAALMTDLILTRQQEKAQSRQQFANKAKSDDEERW